MHATKFFLLVIIFTAGIFSGFSQQQKTETSKAVKWDFSYEPVKGSEDEYIIKLIATVEKGWHMYSQKVAGDGPVPTSFKFNSDESTYKLVGEVAEPEGEVKMDEAFGMEIKSFEGTVIFTQKIKRVAKGPLRVSGELEFMTCNNMQCLPPKTVPFTVEIPAKR